MLRSFRVNVLGAALSIDFHESVPDELVGHLSTLWVDLVDVRPGKRKHLSVGLGPNAKDQVELTGSTANELAASLTTNITFRGLAHNRGRMVMLHAAGVALPDGRVIALVGPSGRGKTTAVRALGAHFGYVTDETIAVSVDPENYGQVLPFRKPLSVVQPDGPKRQVSPRELGLLALPAAPLRLAAIVVLDRTEDGSAIDGEPPAVVRVGVAEALREITPQSSYLAELPESLATMADLIEAVGGVRRVRYTEAATLSDAVPDMLALPATAVSAWQSGTIATGEHPGPPGTWTLSAGARWLDLGDVLITIHQHHLRELTGIAPPLWRTLVEQGPLDLDSLTSAVLPEVGRPTDGSPTELVDQALQNLAHTGLVRANV